MRNATLVGALVVWSLLATAGGQSTYGAPAARMWPVDSSLPRAEAKATVLAFVSETDAHGAAALGELRTVVATARTRPFVAVVHVGNDKPVAMWDVAGRIPRAARLLDKGGIEARRFNATSGEVIVYDSNGILQYSGAIGGLRAALDR